MKKYAPSLIVIMICLAHTLCAQAPLAKQWDYRFGGTGEELLYDFQQTTDGGYILGGYSYSAISGDRTQLSRGSSDYWIIKIDSLGIKQWDKRFGGYGADEFFSMQQTTDGGYILGGSSTSGISGDKTQDNRGAASTEDYWIVKIDSLGNKQWDKRFGGDNKDVLYSLQQTTDGGYILGGYTLSGISGDKTEPLWGGSEYWIVKTDSLGNKQWDKQFGGTVAEYFTSLQQTTDGGYIVGGTSYSGTSGDKTQPTWGLRDYWVVKTDALGNKQWDKAFGGIDNDLLSSLLQTADGGYVLGGMSYSISASGNKTQTNWGGLDYWIVKIDSQGNMLWDKVFGGTHQDEDFGNIAQTLDGGYLIAGTSYSDVSGDKTETNLGIEQIWVVKTDSLWNKEWDKTVLNTAHDESGYAIQTKEGCYAMANYTIAGIGGHKTQSNWTTGFNTADYWIIKFCDTTCNVSIIGADTVAISQPATYSASGGSGFTWRVRNGVIISGQGTNTIQIDWDVARDGTVEVIVAGCGTISKYITLTGYKRRKGSVYQQFPPIHLPGQH